MAGLILASHLSKILSFIKISYQSFQFIDIYLTFFNFVQEIAVPSDKLALDEDHWDGGPIVLFLKLAYFGAHGFFLYIDEIVEDVVFVEKFLCFETGRAKGSAIHRYLWRGR